MEEFEENPLIKNQYVEISEKPGSDSS